MLKIREGYGQGFRGNQHAGLVQNRMRDGDGQPAGVKGLHVSGQGALFGAGDILQPLEEQVVVHHRLSRLQRAGLTAEDGAALPVQA